MQRDNLALFVITNDSEVVPIYIRKDSTLSGLSSNDFCTLNRRVRVYSGEKFRFSWIEKILDATNLTFLKNIVLEEVKSYFELK